MLWKVLSAIGFFARNFFASIISILVPPLLVTFIYFALLAVALATNTGLGGPLALPFLALAAFVASVIYTAFLLFPTVLFAEVVSRVFGKWQHLAQIPISTIALALLILTIAAVVRLTPNYAENPLVFWADHPLATFLALTVPLGLYWWTSKIVQFGISTPIALFKQAKGDRRLG